jgi:hypothetical protein
MSININQLDLKGKNILLICPIFFGYEYSIKDSLTKLGANVLHLSDRPYKNQLLRALTNKFPVTSQFLTEHFYYRKHLNKATDLAFDYVLVINGQTCSSGLIQWLRSSHSRAKFLLYFWDSVANRPDSLKLANHFDNVFTFDPADSKKNDWTFRPLFFTADYALPTQAKEHKYGLSFIATAHTDRFSVSRKIFQQVEKNFQIFKYLYLQAPWVYFVYKAISKDMADASFSDFSFTPLNKKKIRQVFDNSLCVLDIEHPKQIGLTIRTFEALGAGKKLLTTNQSIRDYDFYHEKNIVVVDRKSPLIPLDFLNTPYVPIPEVIYAKYSIDGWLKEIFSR